MIFSKEQIEQIRYGAGITASAAEELMQEVEEMIAEHIDTLYTDEDLIE